MSDEEDVKKLTEVINESKVNLHTELENLIFAISEEEESDFETTIDFNGSNLLTRTLIELTKYPTYSPETTLTSKDKTLIASCKDPDLKKLLLLNRSKNTQLIHLFEKIRALIAKCQELIIFKEKITKVDTNNQALYAYRLAAPYFKTKSMFSAPLNKDAEKQKKNKELSVYDILSIPKWSKIECDSLISATKLNYTANKQRHFEKQLTILKARLKKSTDMDESSHISEEIAALEEDLIQVRELGEADYPPLNSDEHIDWSNISEVFLKGKHTDRECRSFWHLYLHPHLNTSEWDDEEDAEIIRLAEFYEYQDWETIAQKLSTNRSGFLVCLHYFSNLCDKFIREKFTEEEDMLLIETVENLRKGSYIPWNTVEQFFTNRHRNQIIHRYNYLGKHQDIIRGKFTEAEDILLMILVNRFGRNFASFVKYMPHRSCTQLKSRFSCNLSIDIKKGCFTTEEDLLIEQTGRSQDFENWSQISTRLRRSRGQIRQRYLVIKNYLQDNPKKNIADVPKRKHVIYQKSAHRYQFIKQMADSFEDTDAIPTLEAIEEMLGIQNSKRQTAKSTKGAAARLRLLKSGGRPDELVLKDVDAMLIDFFSNAYKISHTQTSINDWKLVEAQEKVAELLRLLDVDLEIPDNFHKNELLDDTDVKILTQLKNAPKSSETTTSSSVSQYVPPNINTVIGLRGLLIKHKLHKAKQKYGERSWYDSLNEVRNVDDTEIVKQIETNFAKLNDASKVQVLKERNVFYSRFQKLFLWPSLMSLSGPNYRLLNAELGIEDHSISTVVLDQPCDLDLTEERSNNKEFDFVPVPDHEPPKEIRIVKVDNKSSSWVPMNLQPVDKSEVMSKLRLQKAPKIFLMDNNSSNGMAVLKQVSDLKKLLGKKTDTPVDKIVHQTDPLTISNADISQLEGNDSELRDPILVRDPAPKIYSRNLRRPKKAGQQRQQQPEKLIKLEDFSSNKCEIADPISVHESSPSKEDLEVLVDLTDSKVKSTEKVCSRKRPKKTMNRQENAIKLEATVDLTEDEIIKNDVELLNEIIKYEKCNKN